LAQLTQFEKSLDSPSDYILAGLDLRISTLRDRTFFHNLADIAAKTERIFMKILPQMYFWTRKTALNFASHSDLDSVSGLRSWSRFTLRSP